jgi:hypothetical protein
VNDLIFVNTLVVESHLVTLHHWLDIEELIRGKDLMFVHIQDAEKLLQDVLRSPDIKDLMILIGRNITQHLNHESKQIHLTLQCLTHK